MSWQSNLMGMINKGKVSSGTIIDSSSGKVYATSPGFAMKEFDTELKDELGQNHKVHVKELQIVMDFFKMEGKVSSPPGLFLNGVKYYLIKYFKDSKTGYLKCTDGGATIIQTKKLIIIGTWEQGKDQDGGECNLEVEHLADKFIQIDY